MRACAETSAELVTHAMALVVPALPTITHLDGNVDVLECLLEVLLLDPTGDVTQVKRGGWRVDVLVVLASRLLEPVKTRVGVVFCQACIRLAVLWQLK